MYVQDTLTSLSTDYDPGSHTLSTGTWYHLAFTLNVAATPSLIGYVNGASDGTGTGTGTFTTPTANFQIGNDQGFPTTRQFSGSIADVAQWHVVLTPAEILALSNGARPYTIRPGTLDLYCPLTGLQSPEPDLSGNRNNGTLTGTTPAFGPPYMQFTPRWPQYTATAAAPTFIPARAAGKNRVIEGVAT